MTRSAAVRVCVVSVLLGVVMGVTWVALAPSPQFVRVEGGFAYVRSLPSEYVAMDGWFAVLGVVAGVVVAVVALVSGPIRRSGVLVVAVASVLGSLLALWVGNLVDATLPSAASVPVGDRTFDGPISISARGVLAAWPIAALAVLMFALAWQHPDRDAPDDAVTTDDAVTSDAQGRSDVDPSVGGDGQVREVGPGQ